MINRYLLIFFVAIGCQTQKEVDQPRGFEVFEIESQILKEKRKILVSLPKYDLSDKLGPQKFPVIYVLDGESMFDYVSSMVNFLSIAKGNDVLPKSIIVGIPNTNRDRDLTPYPIQGLPESGGGSLFADFLAQELQPYIKKNYPTLDYRTIIGHSYGGLFTLYSLYERPELFDNYIALDPSFQELKRDQPDGFEAPQYKGKQLFVGIANFAGILSDTGAKPSNINTSHLEELIKWTQRLKKREDLSLQVWPAYYKNDDHASLCVEATYDALRALFSWYHLDLLELKLEAENGVDIKQKIIAHYKLVSQKMGEQIVPEEEFVNKVAWACLRFPETTKALLQLNLKNHPTSFNAKASIGKFYQFTKQRDSAIFYFEEALKIRTDEQTLKLLSNIRSGK